MPAEPMHHPTIPSRCETPPARNRSCTVPSPARHTRRPCLRSARHNHLMATNLMVTVPALTKRGCLHTS